MPDSLDAKAPYWPLYGQLHADLTRVLEKMEDRLVRKIDEVVEAWRRLQDQDREERRELTKRLAAAESKIEQMQAQAQTLMKVASFELAVIGAVIGYLGLKG